MEFIVGIVLGGVPVLLEAYDRYWDLSEACSTFRHYSKELKKLDTILKTQKTIFRGNVIKLLIAVTHDPEKTRELLTSRNKDQWESLGKLHVHNKSRIESLQEMLYSWEATLDLVLSSVKSICQEVDAFRTSNSAQNQDTSQDLLRELPKRFRLCWRKNEVQDSIKELRDFTSDFNELTARIVVELHDIQNVTVTPHDNQATVKASYSSRLNTYRKIRSASSRLYSIFAMRWSCTQHQTHAASITVLNGKSTKLEPGATDNVKFQVAISGDKSPMWLEIESIDSEPIEDCHEKSNRNDEVFQHMMQNLVKHSQPLTIQKTERTSARLKKNPPCLPSDIKRMTHPTDPGVLELPTKLGEEISKSSHAKTTDLMIDLGMIDNCCEHFQISHQIDSHVCLGYINKDLNTHRFYLLPSERQLLGQPKSLADIIAWISEDEFSRSLSRMSMAQLATSLATAVLQYHSTPWLPETWQSSDVRFFIDELDEFTNTDLILSPYFEAEFSKPDKGKNTMSQASLQSIQSTIASQTMSTTSTLSTMMTSASSLESIQYLPTPSLARNELLFRLGIMLLELGYSQPWLRLKRRVVATLPPRKSTDYHAAEKLAQLPFLRNRMGPRFSTIIRKCLGCDFGLGESDFENEELQSVFLVDVLGALEDVEKGLEESERRLAGGN